MNITFKFHVFLKGIEDDTNEMILISFNSLKSELMNQKFINS